MLQKKWTQEQLLELHRLKQEGKGFKEISKLLGKSEGSVEKKYKRIDWNSFIENPDVSVNLEAQGKKWSQVEMAQLYAFLQSNKSYAFTAEQLGRTYISVERKAQTTNWQAWKAAVGNPESPENAETENKDELKIQLGKAMVELSRQDLSRLHDITEDEFARKINLDVELKKVSFTEVKKEALNQLEALGLGNELMLTLKEGTYVIVGDSHGKFTRTKMFNLLDEVNKFIKPTKIIHVGHLLDDDNEISYNWGMFDNLMVVAKMEELKLLQERRNTRNFKYEIVRGGIKLGSELYIMNQDIISDYVKTSLSTLDTQILDDKVIVNSHRLEIMPKCSEENNSSYIVSPGALCEKHIAKAIKQIDFGEGKVVKQAYHSGFSKYRRMQHMYDYWNQAMLVVNVDSKGNHTIIPCIIRKIGKDYVTSYFNKIITSSGVKNPDKKIFIVADMHAPNHDNNILDIQEQICKDYAADVLVNLGDAHDFRCLNHHEMDKGIMITRSILDDSAQAHYCLKRQAGWAKEKHIIYGNHERFPMDFIAKFPQFGDYLDFSFLCGLEDLGYKMTSLKHVLKIGNAKFIHGDLSMYGQSGSKLEKASKTFGENVFVGHSHYSSIRLGGYTIGLSGLKDQTYNEPVASNWVHGFGMCNQYEGQSFPSTIVIDNKSCILNNKTYIPHNPKSWKISNYKAKLVYTL
jgi:predicted phosphodiesterase